MKNLVKIAKQQMPIVYPKHIAKLISNEPEFFPLVFYLKDVKPIEGEIGIYNGHRVIVNLPVKSK
jgi:uncharacterized protein (DUF3820 family)